VGEPGVVGLSGAGLMVFGCAMICEAMRQVGRHGGERFFWEAPMPVIFWVSANILIGISVLYLGAALVAMRAA
jgi:hypothetical protein